MTITKNSFGLFSIRNRVIAFALLAALIPSFYMGLLLYNTMYSTQIEKVEQKFRDSADLLQRELSLWFKERNYDLTVFASSFIIINNYQKYLAERRLAGQQFDEVSPQIKVMNHYLSNLQKEFDEYQSLYVVDNGGNIVASSGAGDGEQEFEISEDLHNRIAAQKRFRSEIYFDYDEEHFLMMFGTPILKDPEQPDRGMLLVVVKLQSLLPLLTVVKSGDSGAASVYVSLIQLKTGRHFLMNESDRKMLDGVLLKQYTKENSRPTLKELHTSSGKRMMGLFVPFDEIGWGVLLTESYESVFNRAIAARNRNILLICILGIILAIAAYGLVRQILVPLYQLAAGADLVAKGDMDVSLPYQKKDEIGFATGVFNEMVKELRESQIKLEELATTDALTQLANRKRVMTILHEQFEFFKRYNKPVSVLMIDVDHFKKVNDTYGHQAGDEVLRQVAAIFEQNLRNVDAVGRYGGEEFLAVLVEYDTEGAMLTAERIRNTVADHRIVYDGNSLEIRISIGVSKMLGDDTDEQDVLNRADMALYQAKENGRNQTVYLGSTAE